MATIPALKQSFLHSQIRLLSTPLSEPPPREDTWKSSPGSLSEDVVHDVVHKVNTLIRAHNLRTYPAPTIRHVAEQIDALYWAAGAPDEQTNEIDERVVGRGADLREDEAILALPDEWVDEDTRDISGLETFAEAARYQQLRTRLVALSEARAALRVKLAQTKQLKEILRPFERAQEDVQPNLVTEDGELARELERMKALLARVADNMVGLERSKEPEDREKDVGMDATAKIDVILGRRPLPLHGD